MPDDLFVHCPDEECRFHEDPIRLLIANPSQITGDPSLWPWDETDLYLSCPGCNVVSLHFHADVRDFQQNARNGQLDHKGWFRISFRCAREGCRIPVEFHALMGTEVLRETEFAIRQRLRNETWAGVSRCQHPICTTQDQYVQMVPDRGTMVGYDPHAFHWRLIR